VPACSAWLATVALAASDLDPAHPESWRLPKTDLYGVEARGASVWVAGYWGTVLRSTDGGKTWSHSPTPTRETLYTVSFGDERHGWAAGANGVLLRSTDGGASWALQSALFEDEFGESRPVDVHLFGVSAVSTREAWVVGDLGIVLHTRDGSTWEQVRIPEEAFADENFPDRIFNAVDFPDAQHGWITGEFGTTLRTRDGGETWVGERSLVDTPEDIYLYDVSALDEHRAAVSGLAGSVLVTEDGGLTWQPRRTRSSAGIFGISWSNQRGSVVGDRGEMFTTDEHQADWIEPERPRLFNWLTDVAHANEALLFAVGEKGVILRSEDGGVSWKQVAGTAPIPLSGVSVPPELGTLIEPSSRGVPTPPANP
jgi:photosystem II stability/assembly factor-like uncharacterized protein